MAINRVSFSSVAAVTVMPKTEVETSIIRPVWERVIVNVAYGRGLRFQVTDVIHNPTGTLYNDDSVCVVASKCLVLALAAPVFYTARAIWHASRIVVDTVVIASQFFHQLARRENSGPILKGLSERALQDLTSRIQHNLWRVVTTPFIIIGIEVGALWGVISPYEGRIIVGFMERLYNEDKSAKESNCIINNFLSGNIGSWSDLLKAFSEKEVCYLARCFQPFGSISNTEKFQVVQRRPISLLEEL